MKHRITCLFLIAVLLVVTIVPMISAQTVMPRLNNTSHTSTNFTITTAGKATISATYDGYYGITTGATITSYIEKRTLGVFWTKVDIGQPNNEWVDISTDYYDAFGHVVYLDSKGTYRATVVYEIRGTGGAADIIDYQQERTYS